MEEASETVARKPNHDGLDKEWLPLQDWLARVVTKKYPHFTEAEVSESAAQHVEAWITLKYRYEEMKKMVEKAVDRVSRGKQDGTKLNRSLWDLLTKQKQLGKISTTISASFLVDHTVLHFKNVLAAEGKGNTVSKPETAQTQDTSRSNSICSPEPFTARFVSTSDSSRSNYNSLPQPSIVRHTSRSDSSSSESITSPQPSGHVSRSDSYRSNTISLTQPSIARHTSRSDSSSSESMMSPQPSRHVSRSDSYRSNTISLPQPSLARHTSRSDSSSSGSIIYPGHSRHVSGSNSISPGINNNNDDASTGETVEGGKRKVTVDAAPMDMRKRLKLDQEERWKKEVVGIEDEMDALQAYCEKEFDESKEIILQMIKLLEKRKYSLLQIKETLIMEGEFGKYRYIDQISKDVFGDTKRKQTKQGGYVGQSDMLIYNELLKRFCDYTGNSGLMKEDIAFKPVADVSGDEKLESVYIESMESIDAINLELQKRYEILAEGIPQSYRKLFQFLYYSAPIKTVQALVPVYIIVRDFVLHLNKQIGSTDLAKEIEKLKDDQVPTKEINKELGKIIKIDRLPQNCKSKSGLLLNTVVEFFLRNNEKVPFSSDARAVRMRIEETLPEKYQVFIFRCYVQGAIEMGTCGELEGFHVNFIDVTNLSRAVRKMVTFMIECGFNMYEAIKIYINGNLIEVMKKLIKPHEGVNPEANHAILLTRLTHDFIDSIIKNEEPTLPVTKTHRRLLKLRVVNLIDNGQLLQGHAVDKVKINLAVPKMERETLEPISNSNDVNDEDIQDMEGIGDDTIPGSVVLPKAIVIPPLNQKKFFGHLLGLPKVKKNTMVRINPFKESTDSHKVEMASQTTEVHMDMTVLVSVQNKSETEVVQLPKGLVIANVYVVDRSTVVEEELTPSYCMQFIKHFNLYEDSQNIRDTGDFISFGKENNVTTIQKNQRTNFKMFGMKLITGNQDYYTVDAVLEFLHNVKDVETDYEIYLRIAIQKGKQIVRHKDAEDLHAFLHGKLGICSRIDKSFSSEKDKELTQEFEKMKTLDENIMRNVQSELNNNENHHKTARSDSIEENSILDEDPNRSLMLQIKDFLMANFDMKLAQIKEEMSFFIELLEECGHPLNALTLDVFAIPNFREVLKEELKIKLNLKLKERGFLIGEKEDFKSLSQISKNSLKSLPRPTKVKDVGSFVAFAKLFSSEVPFLEEEADKLGSLIQRKALDEDFDWTECSDKMFEDIRKQIVGVTSLQPHTRKGKIELFSAASSDTIAVVIIQEKRGSNDEKTSYPITYTSRLLTPEEEKMTKIEKEAHAVIWGTKFNTILLSDEDFVVNVTSDQLGKMFKPGNTNTASWYEQLKDFKFTVKKIKLSENPAICLTKRDKDEVTRPYARETIVHCLLDENLSLIKRSFKTRINWIKFQRKQRKRSYEKNSFGPGPRGASAAPEKLS